MRLTLRTLLSYLDDTLEPAEAKLIGQKVAESEQARELAERIQQVTRRRRLTTPPNSGPGGLDPNTMAEYLDNEVSPEQAAEVEQVCLASDVHLAEVAACHQILTLVLGEPALVPPSAKQRMYGLVKGPEAIPFRKPAKTDSRVDMDLSSEISGPDVDETLRLGLPWLRGVGGWRNQLLLLGGGAAAAVLLVVALIQLLGGKTSSTEGTPPVTGPVAQAPTEDKEKEKPKPEVREEIKAPTQVEPGPAKKTEESPALPQVPEAIPVKVELPMTPDVPFAKPDLRDDVSVGKVVAGGPKNPSVLMQFDKARSDWKRVGAVKPDVYSNRPLLGLPAVRGTVELNRGVQLKLWGNLYPELSLAEVYESLVHVYPQDKLNADVLLERGRIVLTNSGSEPAYLRVRFEDPKRGEQTFADITLFSKDTSIVVDRYCALQALEPFYEDPKHPNRVGPTGYMSFALLSGSAAVKLGDVGYTLSPPPGAYWLRWNSAQGVKEDPRPLEKLEEVFKENPELPKQLEKPHAAAIKAQAEFIQNLEGKPLDVVLAETVKSSEPIARQLALRGYGAIDDMATIIERFDQDTTTPDFRVTCVDILRRWIALKRDNAYVLLDQLKKRYNKPGAALKIVELLHYPSRQQLDDPLTYENLIEGLNNPVLPIRELSAWHLYFLVPAGRKIAYSPTAPPMVREAAQNAYFSIVPRGQLPTTAQPPAKKS